jgi:hypothetical protein
MFSFSSHFFFLVVAFSVGGVCLTYCSVADAWGQTRVPATQHHRVVRQAIRFPFLDGL